MVKHNIASITRADTNEDDKYEVCNFELLKNCGGIRVFDQKRFRFEYWTDFRRLRYSIRAFFDRKVLVPLSGTLHYEV